MAKKKLKPLEDPPKSSGEEEEEQISDDSDSSSSEEEKDHLWPPRKPKTSVASPSKQRSKRSSEEISPPAKKRSKNKKPLFQRLWSEEDEISLLQGMIDFKSGTGKSPYEDMDGFYELIKKSISFEASKYQTAEKIRSLRKKYVKKVKRGVESVSKSHDMGCFNLSKYIWGSNGMALKSNVKKSDSVKPHGQEVEKEVESDANLEVNGENGDKEEEDGEVLVNGDSKAPGVMGASDWFEDSFLVGSIGSLGVGERFVKQRWSMVAVETKEKLEEKWKLLQAKEMELVLEKTDFMREVGSVIAEAS